ncbi:hypothetical protein HYPGJ_10181 [Hyphomicrobium sp. GJ21]|nr:hypothetical protein HYPGJ_10181 [Hyphomicrobium sp. GJ21]
MSPRAAQCSAPFHDRRQAGGCEIYDALRRGHRGWVLVCFMGKTLKSLPPAFFLQVMAPGAGQSEHPSLIGALLRRQAYAAVAVAGAGSRESDAEQEPVRALAGACTSDCGMRHAV